MKGHRFRRAVSPPHEDVWPLGPAGWSSPRKSIPQEAKAGAFFVALSRHGFNRALSKLLLLLNQNPNAIALGEGWTGKTSVPPARVEFSFMAKLVRYQHCGCFHFVTFSSYRRQPLLDTPPAYGFFERELEAVRVRYGVVVAGYVLMPEHVHLLLGEPRRSSLAVALQVLKQQTSRKLKTDGAVRFWQRRYDDFNVWSEEKRVKKLRYMHRNPVKRGLVERPEQWPWSSFRHYATGHRGTVEIESNWTAFQRGNQLPEDLRYGEGGRQALCSPILR
ncbi:MAG: REP-associated tyrosine transposase [Acidobacteriota bacterium]